MLRRHLAPMFHVTQIKSNQIKHLAAHFLPHLRSSAPVRSLPTFALFLQFSRKNRAFPTVSPRDTQPPKITRNFSFFSTECHPVTLMYHTSTGTPPLHAARPKRYSCRQQSVQPRFPNVSTVTRPIRFNTMARTVSTGCARANEDTAHRAVAHIITFFPSVPLRRSVPSVWHSESPSVAPLGLDFRMVGIPAAHAAGY